MSSCFESGVITQSMVQLPGFATQLSNSSIVDNKFRSQIQQVHDGGNANDHKK
jgi:hypothetical protein